MPKEKKATKVSSFIHYTQGKREKVKSFLPVEQPFTLFINDLELLTFLVTPEKVSELTAGFLWTSGVISSPQEIKEILVDEEKGIIWAEIKKDKKLLESLLRQRFLTSGCGGGELLGDPTAALEKISSKITISPGEAFFLLNSLLKEAKSYQKSGGVHGSALASKKEILYLAEDVGRHNSVDKVLGWAFLRGVSTEDKVLLTTGRISWEMLLKSARAKVPILLSRTSPTNLAAKMAGDLNITLVGYIRGKSMRIYTHGERVKEK